jgi:hypothetical protein
MSDSPSQRPTLAPRSQRPRAERRKRRGLRVSLRLPLHAPVAKHVHPPYASSSLPRPHSISDIPYCSKSRYKPALYRLWRVMSSDDGDLG